MRLSPCENRPLRWRRFAQRGESAETARTRRTAPDDVCRRGKLSAPACPLKLRCCMALVSCARKKAFHSSIPRRQRETGGRRESPGSKPVWKIDCPATKTALEPQATRLSPRRERSEKG